MYSLSKLSETLHATQLQCAVHAVGATVALMIAGAGYSYSTASESGQEATWENTIESGQELLENRSQIFQDRDIAECELFAMNKRLDELTALIPNNPESSRFLAQLAELGGNSKLEIQNFRPGPTEKTDNMQRMRVQLSGAGHYECICLFLNGLRSLPRLTRVTKLQVDPLNQKGIYPVHMELSIFFAADEQATTRVARHD